MTGLLQLTPYVAPLKPFWRYYGGKWRAAPHYPRPIHDTIVEPFAGAAGYACRYPDRNVVLVEKYPVVAEMWRYLIAVRPEEILVERELPARRHRDPRLQETVLVRHESPVIDPSHLPRHEPKDTTMPWMPWRVSDRADPVARQLADRHYNRQKVGSTQFVPPGRCLVLTTDDDLSTGDALWITSYPFSDYVKHRWAGAWVCSAFRNEGVLLSSLLITAATWPPPMVPAWILTRKHDRTLVERADIAMVTFIDESKTYRKRDPGRCYRRAGFEEIGRTKGGLVALGLRTERVPAPREPHRVQCTLAGVL